MITTGIIRRIDDLGRIAIPQGIRQALNISEGTPLEIGTENGNIVLRDYRTTSEKAAVSYELFKTITQKEFDSIGKSSDSYRYMPPGDYSNVSFARGNGVRENDLVFSDGCIFGPFCKFGMRCKFGNGCEFGLGCSFDSSCAFGAECSFAQDCKFSYKTHFGAKNQFGAEYSFQYECTFANECVFEANCKFGDDCTFGDHCNFGRGYKLGCDCIIGNFCTFDNTKEQE